MLPKIAHAALALLLAFALTAAGARPAPASDANEHPAPVGTGSAPASGANEHATPRDAEPAPASDAGENATAADTEALAAAAQNPIANLISLPFQNNLHFGVGPDNGVANLLNIQPVIPFTVGDWNIITRTIVPVIYLADLTAGLPDFPQNKTSGGTFGLGDLNFTAFLSPADSGNFVWGIGPSFGLDTATSDYLGTGKWTAGPSLVGVWTPPNWVVGALARNLWSFAGQADRKSVNSFLLQPFINYNFDDGWYVTTSPVITANWRGDAGNRWTLPLGGGVGRILNLGSQPANVQAQIFGNAVRPENAPAWSLRLQVQLLFPQ